MFKRLQSCGESGSGSGINLLTSSLSIAMALIICIRRSKSANYSKNCLDLLLRRMATELNDSDSCRTVSCKRPFTFSVYLGRAHGRFYSFRSPARHLARSMQYCRWSVRTIIFLVRYLPVSTLLMDCMSKLRILSHLNLESLFKVTNESSKRSPVDCPICSFRICSRKTTSC